MSHLSRDDAAKLLKLMHANREAAVALNRAAGRGTDEELKSAQKTSEDTRSEFVRFVHSLEVES